MDTLFQKGHPSVLGGCHGPDTVAEIFTPKGPNRVLSVIEPGFCVVQGNERGGGGRAAVRASVGNIHTPRSGSELFEKFVNNS